MDNLRCVAATGDICGEGATWSADEHCLYWVDINRFLLHSLQISTGKVKTHFFDEPVVALSLTDVAGKLLVALGSKLVFVSIETDHRQDLKITLPGAPLVRFNDGRTDPRGNFWIGTMSNNVGPNGESLDIVDGQGSLYRYSFSGELEEFENGIGIANTLCWSPDQQHFYFGDTLKNEIRAYSYDMETGNIGVGRPHFSGFDRGLPDGSAIDSQGYLWNCRYGGGCIVRVSPAGEIDKIIDIPAENITTCAFGGADLSTLYITTAREQENSKYRLAGCLFALETDVKGLPENKFITQV